MIQRGMRRPRKKFYISKRALRPGNVIFTIVNTLIMLCVIVVMLYPFWNTIAVSFNDAQDTLRGGIKLFPRVFSLYSYQSVFKNKLMVTAAINSVLRTLATVALWCAVGAWNQWFDTFLYCSSKENLTTLQYEMMKLLSSATQSGRDLSSVYGNGQQVANTITPTSIRAAVTIVASAPILVVYPFLQKYFVKGVTLGATKG